MQFAPPILCEAIDRKSIEEICNKSPFYQPEMTSSRAQLRTGPIFFGLNAKPSSFSSQVRSYSPIGPFRPEVVTCKIAAVEVVDTKCTLRVHNVVPYIYLVSRAIIQIVIRVVSHTVIRAVIKFAW